MGRRERRERREGGGGGGGAVGQTTCAWLASYLCTFLCDLGNSVQGDS